MAVTAAFLGTIGTTATLATTYTFLTTSIIGGLLVSTATSALIGALSPKPSAPAPKGYQTNVSGTALDHPIVYGEVKVGGPILFDETTGNSNKFLHRIIGVAGHEIQSFEEVYINDELATIEANGNVSSPSQYNGKVRINFHLGASDQTADADLVAESNVGWSAQHRLRGIAYMYVRLTFNQDTFPNGIPVFTAVIKGKKLYDPRTNTTQYSSNPALALRDYLSTNSYGLGEAIANIDDTAVVAAANVCDQTNTNAGTTRFTCNGSFTTGSTPYDTISALLTSMGGSLWYAQGKWRMKPSYFTAPVMDINEDDLRSSIAVATRHSRRDNFNVIKGTFRGAESNWQTTDYPQVTNSTFLAADNNQESIADVDLSFTTNSVEARRLGLITLEANRQQLTVSASFGLRTLELQVGDNIRLSNTRFGWSDKLFTIISWSFGLTDALDLQTNLTMQETSSSVFDEVSDGIVYERDNTSLPSAFTVESVGISVTAEVQVSNQKVSNLANIIITATDGTYVSSVEVEYKLSSETNFISLGKGPLGNYEARDLEVGFYDFRARAINTFGVKGQFTVLSNREVNAFVADPSDVSGFNVEISTGSMFFGWTPIPDPDLSHYELKHNSNTVGATWGNSSTVVEKIARPSSSVALPTRSGTFLIRAYDKEGNFSEGVSTLVVQASELPALGVTEITPDQNPSFSGVKTNAVVVSNALEIDNTSSSSPVGEYEFLNYIDIGSSVTARVTGSKTFLRKFDGGTPLWDDIPQNFDTWPDKFDTWSNASADFGDVGVPVFVSVTFDDPSANPTWGTYALANGASFVGRAFRFKAVLNSTSTKFTPSIVDLFATVEY